MKTLFDIAYDNNLFTKAGCKKIFEENNLEADDILAITSKYILSKYPDAKIWIITSDMDYLQLACENITLINLKYNKLTDSKVSFNDAKKDLFCKIVSGIKVIIYLLYFQNVVVKQQTNIIMTPYYLIKN